MKVVISHKEIMNTQGNIHWALHLVREGVKKTLCASLTPDGKLWSTEITPLGEEKIIKEYGTDDPDSYFESYEIEMTPMMSSVTGKQLILGKNECCEILNGHQWDIMQDVRESFSYKTLLLSDKRISVDKGSNAANDIIFGKNNW
jgi:hypothetical protein